MEFKDEDTSNLEQLLESLIKMVGKSNQSVDSLQKRVSQLEWLMKEQQFGLREPDPIRIYTRHPHEIHSTQPIRF